MMYQKIHDAIILRAQHRLLEGFSERHHIVPRCKKRPDVSAFRRASAKPKVERIIIGKGSPGIPKSLAHRKAMSEAGKLAWIERRGTQNY
jgi:hypothetical protein